VKLLEVTIKPLTGFGTPLKGDTVFGHFCWQAAHDGELLNGGLDRWISCYDEKPFAIFSTAFPKLNRQGKSCYALKRPDLPLTRLFPSTGVSKRELMRRRKENAGKKWLLVPETCRLTLEETNFKTDGELLSMVLGDATDETKRLQRGKSDRSYITGDIRPHNTINRLTMTTGEGIFAPYEANLLHYFPETELIIFVLYDEDAADADRIRCGLQRIGRFGYGRDASTGAGRFDITACTERDLPKMDAGNACYALAPVLPGNEPFKDIFFTPFTRFGRHGDAMATARNPFKNPVIMADEGAVFIKAEKQSWGKPYLGRPAVDVSIVQPQTVVQGYAPCLPFHLEI